MSIEQLQYICDQLEGVTQDIIGNKHLCFSIGSEMILVIAISLPHSACFKVDEESFEELRKKNVLSNGIYLAQYNWVYVDDINRLSKVVWTKYITIAYTMAYSKLPEKTKRKRGVNPAKYF